MTPASIRNNNPGAMEPGPSSKKFGATSYETLRWSFEGREKTNLIATFATPQHGAAAQFDLLERKYTGMPLQAAVTKWCGSYWAGDYAKALEAACGIGATEMLTKELVRDHARAIPLAKAMAKVEAGRDYPLDDAGWLAGHSMAFAAALAPAPSPDNDVPYQKPEARVRETVATVGKVIGGISIPAVPVAATQNVVNAEAWQTIANQGAAVVKWGITSPLALAILAGMALLLALPKFLGGKS